jgi:hypothetical protein
VVCAVREKRRKEKGGEKQIEGKEKEKNMEIFPNVKISEK